VAVSRLVRYLVDDSALYASVAQGFDKFNPSVGILKPQSNGDWYTGR